MLLTDRKDDASNSVKEISSNPIDKIIDKHQLEMGFL